MSTIPDCDEDVPVEVVDVSELLNSLHYRKDVLDNFIPLIMDKDFVELTFESLENHGVYNEIYVYGLKMELHIEHRAPKLVFDFFQTDDNFVKKKLLFTIRMEVQRHVDVFSYNEYFRQSISIYKPRILHLLRDSDVTNLLVAFNKKVNIGNPLLVPTKTVIRRK